MKKLLAAVLALGLAASLSACSNDSLANQFRSGDNKNYISGDGSVTEFKSNLVSGKAWTENTFDSQTLSSDAMKGHVIVLNFWYAGCAPCRAEVADLVKVTNEYKAKGVYVVGVNVRDSAETAMAFARTHNLNYPSVMDIESGSVVQAYTGVVSPSAVPTTLVLNTKGQVTARVLGRFEPTTLRSLINTAVSGK